MDDRHILTVQEDPETGELYLPFPEDVMDKLGWVIGDTLTWTKNDNGSFTISKKVEDQEQHNKA
jgi:hypothetical protein